MPEGKREITAINYNVFTMYLAVQNISGREKKKDVQGYDNPARKLSHSTVNLISEFTNFQTKP